MATFGLFLGYGSYTLTKRMVKGSKPKDDSSEKKPQKVLKKQESA